MVSWREFENEFEQMAPHNGQVLIQFPNRGKALLETPGEGMQNKTRWGGWERGVREQGRTMMQGG